MKKILILTLLGFGFLTHTVQATEQGENTPNVTQQINEVGESLGNPNLEPPSLDTLLAALKELEDRNLALQEKNERLLEYLESQPSTQCKSTAGEL